MSSAAHCDEQLSKPICERIEASLSSSRRRLTRPSHLHVGFKPKFIQYSGPHVLDKISGRSCLLKWPVWIVSRGSRGLGMSGDGFTVWGLGFRGLGFRV